MPRRRTAVFCCLVATAMLLAPGNVLADGPATAPAVQVSTANHSLWFWPTVLFVVSFALGVVAVLGGVGGGVLYVPLIGGFFPFHLQYVQCAGLMVALSGSVAAGPGLLRKGLANLRLAMPVALVASICAIFGAMIGLHLPSDAIQTALGGAILGIAAIMLLARRSQYPQVDKADRLSSILRITGVYREESSAQDIDWKIHRTPLGLCMFVLIGIMAGMFGVGAGWANVPVLNLVMGAPLKLSVATSKFLIATTDSTAAWVYVHNGATLPIIVIPSVIGIMLGSLLGVWMLKRIKPTGVRYVVLAILLFCGSRSLLKGLHIWE